MAIDKKLVTVDEFEDFIARPENRDRLFELIDGEVVEVSPTQEHGFIALNIGSEIRAYLRRNPLGIASVETRHRTETDRYNDYVPDVSFVSHERGGSLVKKGPVRLMPDIAVEVKSPDDSVIGMRKKAEYYLANGSRMVWLVYPEKRTMEIYQPDADIEMLNENDEIVGDPVLPGFRLSVRDVFNL